MTKLSIKKQPNTQVFKTGNDVLEEKGLAIVWMSVGNSYFKPNIIGELINFASKNFSKVRILAPFEPAIHTYKAIGYQENKAKRKARLNSNRLKNHTKRAIENLKNKNANMKIIDWDVDILPNKSYKKIFREIKDLYSNNKSFQRDAKDTTKQVLKDKTKEKIDIEKATTIGVKYLIKELAFVLASPKIFGVSKTTYVYHNKWPIYENLVNGKYDKKARRDVGFTLVNY